MAFSSDTNLVNDERFQRYITLIVAFKFTREGLEDTVNRSVVDLYQKYPENANELNLVPTTVQMCTDQSSKNGAIHVQRGEKKSLDL